MAAGPVRAEVKIAVADTAEDLHQVPATGALFFSLIAVNESAAPQTIRATVNTVTGTHGTHRLIPHDFVLDAGQILEVTGRSADASDYIVVESNSTSVYFMLSGRQEA